jgi:Uma2 family endonuclease
MVTSRIFDTITVEEYLEAENDGNTRHEYVYGEIYAMAGASVPHNLINVNITTLFKLASKGTNCRVYASDMKVRVDEEIFYYPDVLVACQDIQDNYYENNPCVIVEVISKITARNDLLEKRLAYIKMERLQLYLLVDSRKRWVKAYRRVGSQWEEITVTKEQILEIPCISGELTLEDIYDGTDLT